MMHWRAEAEAAASGAAVDFMAAAQGPLTSTAAACMPDVFTAEEDIASQVGRVPAIRLPVDPVDRAAP
jgi:hypothetical protein